VSAALQERQDAPTTGLAELVDHCIAYGQGLIQQNAFVKAERIFRTALDLDPNNPSAHDHLGRILELQDDNEGAIAFYKRALTLDPNHRPARRNLAKLVVRLGRSNESLPYWHAELVADAAGSRWVHDAISEVMTQSRDLTLAGEYAALLAGLQWGSRWYPGHGNAFIPQRALRTELSIPKLRHDIGQFLYLQRIGVLGSEFSGIVRDYERVIEWLVQRDPDARAPLAGGDAERLIGHVYNRIIRVRYTPRMDRALGHWDTRAVEREYLNSLPGVVVVDDFLASNALSELRAFCLESTVWSTNRYAYGRLGAFFHDGFNCPLLLQIAEELREALPTVIGDRYPVRQIWGFKNSQPLPGNATTHADFAAVNVNFWITPAEANLDSTCGGLVVYGIDAPLHWDFATYNGRSDVIRPFLKEHRASSVTIPYRQNRAIIFNSDLFHATDAVNFDPGYENHRINVTVLYGDREQDTHRIHHDDVASTMSAWRSPAITRSRWS
jgi:hypothetical protein